MVCSSFNYENARSKKQNQPNVFLTGTYRVLVTDTGQSPFPCANHCQGQLLTPQSVSVLNVRLLCSVVMTWRHAEEWFKPQQGRCVRRARLNGRHTCHTVTCRSDFSAYCVTTVGLSALPCHLWMGVECCSLLILPKTVATPSRGFNSKWRCCNLFVVTMNERHRRHHGGPTL